MLNTKLQSEEFKFYFLFFLSVMFFFSMLAPISYGDLGVWIAEGRQILQQGTVYIRDVHSFNPTDVFPYPWLSCLFYYFLDANFALDSIFILHRIIPVAVVAFWLTRYPTLSTNIGLLCLLLCFRGVGMLTIDRPALLVLPLIPYFYDLIDSEKIYNKKLKSLFLLVLWTNLHGSFVLFLLLLGYKNLVQFVKKPKSLRQDQILFFGLALLATLINPWGFKIYNYVLKTAEVSKIRMGEWQPLTLFENGQIAFDFFYFYFALLLLTAFIIRKRKVSAFISSPLPLVVISALLAVRNVPLFFTVLPLFWGKHLMDASVVRGYAAAASPVKVFLHRCVVVVFVLAGIFMYSDHSEKIRSQLSKNAQRYDETSAFRIADYLQNVANKKIFNDWILGSFFIYGQSNQVFIDTRNIIYSDQLYSEYLSIVENRDGHAESRLDRHNVDYVVSAMNTPLTTTLMASKGWTFIMEDNGYSLFEKKQ